MIETDIRELNEKIQRESQFLDLINLEMNKVIVGQKQMTERLLIGLLANGHILLEGVPGLAKTLAIKSMASAIDADFARIQFTPDLLPADLIGTLIYSQKKDEFVVRRGPIFANFVLAEKNKVFVQQATSFERYAKVLEQLGFPIKPEFTKLDYSSFFWL